MRNSRTTLVLGFVCAAAFSVTACAARGVHGGSSARLQTTPPGEVSRFGRRSNVLTANELIKAGVISTAEGVRRLRPEFFRATQVATPTGPAQARPSVYVNGVYAGGIEALDLIALSAIQEIRFVRSMQAKEWWGAQCSCDGGVIAVRTKRAE